VSGPIGAIVVDHDAGPLLWGCVRSVLGDGASAVVVVENGAGASTDDALEELLHEHPAPPVRVVRPGRNPRLRGRRESGPGGAGGRVASP